MKRGQTSKILLLLIITGLWGSCVKDAGSTYNVENPVNYEFLRDGNSTVSFSGQTTRISMATELTTAMKDFDSSGESLLEMYANQSAAGDDVNPFAEASLNESTKSVKSKVAASADFFSANTAEAAVIKAQIESWITAQVNEVFPNSNELASAGVAGQIADGTSVRYVNAKGLEYDQAVAKSLIGALMVDQICNNYLSTALLDENQNQQENTDGFTGENNYTTMEHKWDEAYGYLFGKSNDAGNPLATIGEDNFLNKYLSRVNDDSDFNGIAEEIFEAYKLGRAAIVAGDYDLRDQQAEILKQKISEVIAIRAVYYLQSGKRALEANDFGGAFHDLSEGLGFIYSLRFTRRSDTNESYFSRAEVDGYLEQLTDGHGFWALEANTIDDISAKIAGKFEFTIAEAGE